MKKIATLLAALAITTSMVAQHPAYVIFNAKGKKASYERMVKEAKKAHVVFFGELHNNPISHWLQLSLTKDLFEEKGENLVLAAEMFERDNQLLLNEYMAGFIRKKDFEREAKLWPNHETDYAPLVDFARENNLKFIGTNIPRRYAAKVNKEGFAGLDSINAYQRAMIAPLPIKFDSTLECYAAMRSMFKGGGGPMAHQVSHIDQAQAIKDATMGWFIFKSMGEDLLVLHFNGSYHSDNYEGTVWYAKDYARRFPFETTMLTITSVSQDQLDKLDEENTGKADFIVVIPSDMTTTY
jgi:uncharacterized iron-regulated protein